MSKHLKDADWWVSLVGFTVTAESVNHSVPRCHWHGSGSSQAEAKRVQWSLSLQQLSHCVGFQGQGLV